MRRVPRTVRSLTALLLATAPTAGAAAIPPPGGSPGGLAVGMDDRFIDAIERAHGGRDAFEDAGALRVQIRVMFADETILDGTLTHHEASGRTRIEMNDGTLLVFDGHEAWYTSGAEVPFGARYQLRTWPFFLTMPFQLRDDGTHVKAQDLKAMQGKFCETARVTFDPGAIDAPDDWYLLYQDPHGRQLSAMAYVVTYGRSKADGEPTPYSVVFNRHARVDGILLPTRWSFHEWSEINGPHGQATGSVVVSNPEFVEVNDADFLVQAGMVRDEKR